MKYTTYDPATGQVQATFVVDTDILPENSVAGEYSSRTHYWDGQQMREKSADPSGIVIYKFDYGSKSWQVDVDKSSEKIKNIRKEMLQLVDRVNPVWYAALSPQQQQELQAYRQALLDIPQQSGFPVTVEWPAKPTWL